MQNMKTSRVRKDGKPQPEKVQPHDDLAAGHAAGQESPKAAPGVSPGVSISVAMATPPAAKAWIEGRFAASLDVWNALLKRWGGIPDAAQLEVSMLKDYKYLPIERARTKVFLAFALGPWNLFTPN